MASTNWMGVKNNPEGLTQEYLEKYYIQAKARYVCGQLEVGEEGTPHIQFYINFIKPGQRLSYLQKIDKHCHYEKCKSAEASQRYCLKEETRLEGPFEFGEKPIRRNNKDDWQEVLTSAKAGDLSSIPASILIPHYRNLKAISGDFTIAKEFPSDRGIWIVGKPGVGKTHYVRHNYGDRGIYWKAQNKWWDGYQQEDVACIDDMDSDCLSHYLKTWSHKWPCYGEVKGARVALNYSTLIVTSNFTIEELFAKQPPSTIEAIARRFKIIRMEDPFNVRQTDQEVIQINCE